MKPSSRAAGLIAVVLLGAVWLWWICQYDNGIPFLAQSSDARWILYPKPLDSMPHRVARVSTVFKRDFKIDRLPSTASISIRCFKAGSVAVNGQTVTNLILDGHEWKKLRSVEVGSFLRAGENEISITVSNSVGPPALWFVFECGGVRFGSDTNWQASCLGAAWQSSALANDAPIIRAGNPLFGSERIAESLRRTWPELILIAIAVGLLSFATRRLAAVVAAGSDKSLAHQASRNKWQWLRDPALAAMVVVIFVLAVLFCNNLAQLAPLLGFDRDGHLQYIDYILQKKALPLADEGWQMYQPPLFYLLSALMIAPFSSSASTDSSVLALRALCAVISIAHVVLIFLCLRLLFPKQTRHQLVGLGMAAFLPASLCLAHNITNESLAALFVTAALYFALRSIQFATSSLRLHVAVGICLGLAMLTKFSALLSIPPICAALCWKGCQRALAARQKNLAVKEVRIWHPRFKEMLLVVLACAVVCGWHYARVWAHFGNPLIGNWDPRLPFAWWQEPGFRTSTWYYRFGEAFNSPLFANLTSFADGLCSTLWGDGLCSGSARMSFRPQWNYDLMNAGYLLAVFPAALLFIGLVVSCVRLLRKPDLGSFLSVSLIALYNAGILLMTLRVPSFAQVKAFYALPALLPACLLCVIGLDSLARRAGWRSLLSVGMVAWAIVVYASLWIRPGNPFTHTVRGVGLADDGRYGEAVEEFSRALLLASKDCEAYRGLIESLTRGGNREEARRQGVAALQACPNDAGVQMQLGGLLGLDGKYEEAVVHLRQAIELASDSPGAYLPVTTCLARLGQSQRVVEAAREGLRVNPFNVDLHLTIAAAYAGIGDQTNEVAHLRIATQLKPDRVDTLNNLGWLLASSPNENIRNGAEAIELAERACELTQRREPVLLGTLAAAYAAAGRFKDAVATAEEARDKAMAAGQNEVAENNRHLLEFYRAGKPYVESGH
jgi:tetratricopeptide (TPR) repeat protein